MDSPVTAPHPELLTVAEVAAHTRHDGVFVRNWIMVGVAVAGRRVRLAGQRIGGRFLVRRDALDRFLADCGPAIAAAQAKREQARAAKRLDASRHSVTLPPLLGGVTPLGPGPPRSLGKRK